MSALCEKRITERGSPSRSGSENPLISRPRESLFTIGPAAAGTAALRALAATATLSILSLFAASTGSAQTDSALPNSVTNSKTAVATSTSAAGDDAVRAEQIRAECVARRRMVCGRVVKVLTDGLVVESGYTNLLRKELHGAWVLPGTVVASRPPDLVESQQPDSPCVGTVFLTDLPRPRGGGKVKVKPYDYVVLRGYPAGQYAYSSVGDIQRTVRRFSVGLETAVKLRLQPRP